MTKIEIAITTLLLGYIAGQLTDFLKYKWEIHRKKKAIEEEIDDIISDFMDALLRIKQLIKEVNQTYMGIPIPSKINNIIYQKHFVDVAPYFERLGRKTIHDIYRQVNNFNHQINDSDFSTIEASRKSFIPIYTSAKLGYESAVFFKNNRGKLLLKDQREKMAEINQDIQDFATSVLK